MRVALEAASLTLSSGGLARYTAELSTALARAFPDGEFFLVSDRPFPMPSASPANLKRGGGPRTPWERRWWLWGLNQEAGRLQADVIHGPDFAVPYLPRRPTVLTLHDLSPWMDSRWHSQAGRVRTRTPLLIKMGIPTMIITPSEVVRRQAMERFGVRPERIVAIAESAPSWLRRVQPQSERPYFLYVGALEPRKNLPSLVEAWRQVRQYFEIDLMIAGRRRADAPELKNEPGLHLLGEVPDDRLAELYSGALALVYPSLYEGFGLPVLEAMQCGACVITSPALRETGGEAAVYAESVDELVSAMRQAAACPQWLAERRALALARAREFSWDRTARRTHEVYLEARERFQRNRNL
jgi:glycosyltransferase involved in cell wall biosynthesis